MQNSFFLQYDSLYLLQYATFKAAVQKTCLFVETVSFITLYQLILGQICVGYSLVVKIFQKQMKSYI